MVNNKALFPGGGGTGGVPLDSHDIFRSSHDHHPKGIIGLDANPKKTARNQSYKVRCVPRKTSQKI